MKKSTLALATAAALFATTSWANMETENGQINYKVGTDVGKYLKDSEIGFDNEAFMTGLEDGLAGRELRLTKEQLTAIRGVIQQKQQKAQEVRRAEMMAEMEKQKVENKAAGDAFMAKKKSEDGVKATDSGILYEVLTEGTGPKPAAATDTVVVHYTGTLIDGTKFDSSVDRGQPATFALNQVIKGWTEGVQLMNTGSKYRFYIPSELAYGSDARPGSPIGPNSTLIFDIELIEVKTPKAEVQAEPTKQ
ncbi:FKBP-type peptidyl-prolyl cis-trans isomerase [Marinicella rhabdoformis]|uniref:FKBP-type peptidyl-prolyl cis-trans isomerase n=1 Tax=Marinicella rhabdoformis TaxID=2580566 RepID=UPI0012AEC072|nr:FKBP-type peptidyl-prolyl cis-trans isomerase [Marinicella rhabdoformis]